MNRDKLTVITEAFLESIIEQEGHPVIRISRRFTKPEEGYSQTVLEAVCHLQVYR